MGLLLVKGNANKKWILFMIASQLPWVLISYKYYYAHDSYNNCCSITSNKNEIHPEPEPSPLFSTENGANRKPGGECLDLFVNVPAQDDEGLIQLVRDKYVFPPDFSLPYHLSKDAEKNWDRSQTGQVSVVRDFLANKTSGPGFFIECGANDGEFFTNTLWFERALGWNGLLVEAEPSSFEKLKSKNRRAWITNTCLSPSIYPEKLSFYRNAKNPGAAGRDSLVKIEASKTGLIEEVKLKCFPLYTLLAAINITHVDFFSLDIEGAELAVLKTIPFDKISFKVLLIEYNHMKDRGVGLHKLMKEVGYTFYKQLKFDRMYVHSSLLPKDWVEPKV